jgi:hypothetical protein
MIFDRLLNIKYTVFTTELGRLNIIITEPLFYPAYDDKTVLNPYILDELFLRDL